MIGILAATDRKAATASLAAASDNGVPTLALEDTPPGATSTAFQLIHAPEARVAALARAALKAGARDFAMLGPDSTAGKRLRDAFRREVTGAVAASPATRATPPGATSFGNAVAAIKKTPPTAGGEIKKITVNPAADQFTPILSRWEVARVARHNSAPATRATAGG